MRGGSRASRRAARPSAAPDAAGPRSGRIARAAWCAALAVATGAIYAQTLGFDFVNFDDDAYVYANPRIREGLSVANLGFAFVGNHANLWHPLTTLSHLADVECFGLWAGGHHATSAGLHIAAAVVLFLALRSLTGDDWPSGLAAALFALHPLRVESVAWISERKDVLSGLLFACLLGAYARYARRPSRAGYLGVVGLFVLGCLAKPMLVTAPCVLLLLDYWPLGRVGRLAAPRAAEAGWRRLVAEKLPLLALSAVVGTVTVWVQQPALASLERIGLSARLANAAVSYLVYLRQFVWPTGLSAFYPHAIEGWTPGAVAAVLVLLAVSAAVARWRAARPYLAVGWFWYLGMLVPVIGIVQVGAQAHADRFTYLPQIGLAIAVAWTLDDLTKSSPGRRALWSGVLTCVLLALAVASWRQTGTWRDGVALFTRVVQCTTRNAVAHNNLGIALGTAGREAEALEQFRLATEIDPRYATAAANYGDALRQAGQFERAEAELARAFQLDPNNLDAANNRASVLIQLGRHREAEEQLEALRQRAPTFAPLWVNRGLIYFREGDLPRAIEAYERALTHDPASAAAQANLALARYQQGDVPAALAAFRASLGLRPDHVETLRSAAWIAATDPRADRHAAAEALAWAERAVELTGGAEPLLWDVWAAALANAGRFPEAVALAERALQQAASQGQPELAATIQAHLHRYRAGLPVRQGSAAGSP